MLDFLEEAGMNNEPDQTGFLGDRAQPDRTDAEPVGLA